MADEEEELGHVILEVNDDSARGTSGERVWAKDLGNDFWEIRNTPWHTCAVAWGDVVLAKSDAPDHWPTFVKVVKPSGHKTLQVYFVDGVAEKKRNSILKKFHDWKATHESANGKLYSLDVEPEGDFQALVDFLHEMKAKGVLDFRTMVRGRSNA